MKKLCFAFCMIILCSSQVAMAQSKTKTPETKAYMLKVLRDKAARPNKEIPKAKSEKFADCLTKDLSERLNLEELRMFYKMNILKNGPEKDKLTSQAEKMGMPEKLKTLGKDCASILQ